MLWGCDAQAELPGYFIDCYVCHAQSPAIYGCPACKGTGQLGVERCPSKYVTPETEELLRTYERYREGHLPVAGGLVEQAQCFYEALPWVSREWAFHEWLSSDPKARGRIEQGKVK